MEASREPLQAHCRNYPVAVATRTFKQVNLPHHAFDESAAKLRHKHGIAACRSGESRFKGTCFISHFPRIVGKVLRWGLLPLAT